jgi:hypothetical protein
MSNLKLEFPPGVTPAGVRDIIAGYIADMASTRRTQSRLASTKTEQHHKAALASDLEFMATTIKLAPIEVPPLPLAVRLRDESGPPLPQMVVNRRAQLENATCGAHHTGEKFGPNIKCAKCSKCNWRGMSMDDRPCLMSFDEGTFVQCNECPQPTICKREDACGIHKLDH